MTFVDGNTVIGNQGTNGRVTTFSGSTATLDATIPLGANQRPLDYAVIGGVPVLAVLDTNYLNNASIVSVYDLTNPAAPVLLASGTATSGTLINNVNATGSVQWGAITGNSARLYAMSTNHGIQAFTVVVDLPAAALPYGSGCGTPALALSAVGAPILPSTYQLQVDNLQPSVIAGFFIFGLVPIPAGAPIPIAPGCMQYVLPITTLFFFPAGAPSFQQPQNLPNDPTYKGLSIYVQAGSFDVSSAILASNGLRLRLNTF
ncbi:MAG: hypothetical protein FJ265_20480 [Planctomycetes bacterium]|nr:hypothetical protein [Planctomycetota bacterium]